MPTVADGKAYVVSTQTAYDTLADAIKAAGTTDTIYLGSGTYSTYGENGIGSGKTLTMIGQGSNKTTWNIGTPTDNHGNEGNSDYSLQGAVSITFKDMTLQAGVKPDGTIDDSRDYLGFSHIEGNGGTTVVENCVINGKTSYWGYNTATFRNTTFNGPSGTYAVWIYSAFDYTFDGCTFHSNGFLGGHVLHAYRDYDSRPAGSRTITINYSNNKVSFGGGWQYKLPIDIKDGSSNYCGNDYIINISGNNSVSGYRANTTTCSRLFAVENTNGNGHPATINIEGTTVWTKGAMVDHEMDFNKGSYNNGNASGTDNQYTEGYKDDAYTTTETDEVDEATGLKYKKITRRCNYCGWSSDKNEAEKESKNLPADIEINTDNKVDAAENDTEHDAVTKVKAGQKVALIGALQASEIADQMEVIEAVFKNPDGSSIALSDLQYSFSATLTLPDGMSLPENITVTPSGLAETFTVDNGTVSEDGKSVTVKFSLTDEARDGIKTYADLKNLVKAAGLDTDGWLKITIPDVQIDADVAAGTRLKVTGSVEGSFEGTATGSVRTFTFPYAWSGTQWVDGKDAAATDDTTIQLTVEIVADSTPDPSEPEHKRHDGGYGDITLYKVDGQTGKALAGARIALYKSNGDYVGTYTTNENGAIEIKNAAYSTYYFQEMQAPTGYALDNTHQNLVLDKDHPNVTIKFTNSQAAVPTVMIGGSKTWVGDSEADRPASITLHLYANGVEVGTAVTTAEQNWVYSLGTQAVSDASGKAITYTVTEDAVAGYTTTVAAPVLGDGTIVINVTNTYNGAGSTGDGGKVNTTDATITTGDDSNMALYGMLCVAAIAALAAWSRKVHVR